MIALLLVSSALAALAAGSLPDRTHLCGRAVDENSQPIVSKQLVLEVGELCEARRGWRGEGSLGRGVRVELTTDAHGRFDALVERVPGAGCERSFVLEVVAGTESGDGCGSLWPLQPRARITLPRELRTNVHGLGDIVLALPGSSARLARLGDDALATRLDALLGLSPTDAPELADALDRGALLREIVRRGGERWSAQLAERHAALRRERAATHVWPECELELLTALRRVEARGDPLRLQVASVSECTFPPPVLDVRLRNADASEDVRVLQDRDRAHGQFPVWRVEGTRPDGRAAERAPGVDCGGGGTGDPVLRLRPGESFAARLDLAAFVLFDAPGTYRLRVRFHESVPIQRAIDVRPLLTSDSGEFELTVHARTIELTRAEHGLARTRFAALDPRAPAELVRGVPHGGWRARDREPEPFERLVELGWRALPTLFDALDDARTDPAHRAWAFALLHDITGLLDPTTCELRVPRAVSRLRVRWAQVGEDGAVTSFTERLAHSEDEPDAADQARLAELWRRVRPMFVTQYVD